MLGKGLRKTGFKMKVKKKEVNYFNPKGKN